MKKEWTGKVASCALAAIFVTALPAIAEPPSVNSTVVNIVPWKQSGETKTDSEPNLAVNPADTQKMAASAFTPGPPGATHAPIYVSIDGGQTWTLNSIVPGNHTDTGTGDITLRSLLTAMWLKTPPPRMAMPFLSQNCT